MNPIVVIPARMAATRLPGKPLADIGGRPMILRVLDQARAAGVGPVAVAAGDPEIVQAVKAAGGQAVLTDPALPSGSDRILAALAEIDPEGRHDVVINLQGDMPFVEPGVLKACADLLQAQASCDIATVVAKITVAEELSDIAVVKAAVSFQPGGTVGPALYFSRNLIPSGPGDHYHHIGIYAFRRAALRRFVTLKPTVLELRERLEQLRAIENGMRMAAALVDTIPLGVDTPSDLDRARRLLGFA